jgi:hypothetical protein
MLAWTNKGFIRELFIRYNALRFPQSHSLRELKLPFRGIVGAKIVANYTINKRSRKKGTVYCARVRAKESGVVTFSKSKTFNSKVAATRWAKETVHKVSA